MIYSTVKPVLNGHSQKDRIFFFKTNYRLMHGKSIAALEHSAILSIFNKLASYHLSLRSFVMSSFEWPFYTGFTVPSAKSYLQPNLVTPYFFFLKKKSL